LEAIALASSRWHGRCISIAMKTNLYLSLLAGAALSLVACADGGDNRPIPGTVEATSTKDNANMNNTPRTNPTPNPDPESQPPDQVTRTTTTVTH
jgi:hypothetical protein